MGVFKRVVSAVPGRGGDGGGAHVDIAAVRHRILAGRDHGGAIRQSDSRFLGAAVVDKPVLVQRDDGRHRLFGNLHVHAGRSKAGVIGGLHDTVPDGVNARVDALGETGGIGSGLAQGVLHIYARCVYHRPGADQHLIGPIVG